MGPGAGGRVLHVDDDPQYADVVATRLEARSDLSVATALTAADALEHLEAEAFDCLLVDYRLPDADGLAVVRRVRDAHPDLPVILLTGEGSEGIASEAITAGVTDYFRKDEGGDSFELLTNRIETAVEKYRTERRLREERRRTDEFVRLVAHDLRNPMAVVRGWIDVLHDDGDEVAYRKAVDALHRMDEIVDNIETLARSGDAEAGDDRVELSAVATAAWELVETDGADLHVEYGPEVRADASMLQQILENLFTNAVEHGSTSPRSQAHEDAVEHGGADVTVRVGTTPDGFYVADDGSGIPDDERDRIFESGYTGDGGSGLGLAIVRRIADAHGWDVDVGESEPGGARFDVTGVSLQLPKEAFR